MIKNFIIFCLLEYLIPLIWLLIPKLIKDKKIIKIIRMILIGFYIYPILMIIILTIINNDQYLFHPYSQHIFSTPILTYLFMIRFTFTKKEKDNTEKNIEIEKTQPETEINEINK